MEKYINMNYKGDNLMKKIEHLTDDTLIYDTEENIISEMDLNLVRK